jgi:hypothetical protein
MVVLVPFFSPLGISYVALTRGGGKTDDPSTGTQAFENAQAGISEFWPGCRSRREQYIGGPPAPTPGWG